MKYRHHARFEKQFKKLCRKYCSLEDDLKIVEKAAIELWHIHKRDNSAVELVPKFDFEAVQVYKIKKFACKSLKGRGVKSGIRVIYAYHITSSKIEFIEIYFKGEKENENRERIKEYLRMCQ